MTPTAGIYGTFTYGPGLALSIENIPLPQASQCSSELSAVTMSASHADREMVRADNLLQDAIIRSQLYPSWHGFV